MASSSSSSARPSARDRRERSCRRCPGTRPPETVAPAATRGPPARRRAWTASRGRAPRSSYLVHRLETPAEQDRHDGNLMQLRVRLEPGKGPKCTIAGPNRKGMERLVLRHGPVGDAVHAVDVLAVEIDVRLLHLPGMVLLHHCHPLAVGRNRHAARVGLAVVQQRVAAVELLRLPLPDCSSTPRARPVSRTQRTPPARRPSG